MRYLSPLSALILGFTTTGAFADNDAPLTLNYAAFEAAVPHIDLESCPTSVTVGDVFCRATMAHDQIHVFVFSQAGESPLVGFASFDAEALTTLLN